MSIYVAQSVPFKVMLLVCVLSGAPLSRLAQFWLDYKMLLWIVAEGGAVKKNLRPSETWTASLGAVFIRILLRQPTHTQSQQVHHLWLLINKLALQFGILLFQHCIIL